MGEVNSGFTPENIADAEWLWSNINADHRRFHNLPTHHKAMICHTAQRFRADRITELEAENAKLKAMQSDDGELLTIAYMDGSHRSTRAHRAKIAELEAVIARLRLDIEAQEALQVSIYHAGMKLGWNCAVTDDREEYDRAIAGTEHVRELRRIREARAALAKAKESLDD